MTKKGLGGMLALCLLCAFLAGCADSGAAQAADEAVDMDLSGLSSALAYAQVVNILEAPDDYQEQTIKIRGQYYPSYYEPTQHVYHFVVVGDETLCCQAGMEFIWNGSHTYPGDYPEEQTEIEVAGVFGSYEELGVTYYCLTIDDISRIE